MAMQEQMAQQAAKLKQFEEQKSRQNHTPSKPPSPLPPVNFLEAQLAAMQKRMAEQDAKIKQFEEQKSLQNHAPSKPCPPVNPLEAQLAEMQARLAEQDKILLQYRGSSEGSDKPEKPEPADPAPKAKPSEPAADELGDAIDTWIDESEPIVMPDGCKVQGVCQCI